jgi:transcriptional regulator with XRE-family HTH domain
VGFHIAPRGGVTLVGVGELVFPLPGRCEVVGRESESVTRSRRDLGAQLAVFRRAADGMTQGELAGRVHADRTTITHLENGRPGSGTAELWAALDTVLGADGALITGYQGLQAVTDMGHRQDQQTRLVEAQARAQGLRHATNNGTNGGMPTGLITPIGPSELVSGGGDDELDALELARRVTASDVSDETLTRLEAVFDDLATSYPKATPSVLLGRLRTYLSYISQLIDAKATLGQKRRLVTVAGWLSLLAATVHIDLKQGQAATARLKTADRLAQEAGHDEIQAWCLETEAWRVLTDGNYPLAVELSQAAQRIAPTGSSVLIQSTMQEGRAHARLGQREATTAAVTRVHGYVANLARPDRPEHHYRYDPDKAIAYTATTLAWAGDPAAETYARETITRLAPPGDIHTWPRRVASAKLDLALTLLITNQLDEACYATQQALESGKIVPSNHWRAAEVINTIEQHQLPETQQLKDAYHQLKKIQNK